MTTKSINIHLSNRLSSQSLIRKTGSTNLSSNPMTQTSPNFQTSSKNLPSLNISEPNQSLFLKQSFEEFSDSVSRFLRGSNSSVSYRDSISTRLTEINRHFDSFFSYFQKQNSIRYQNRNINSSNRITFKTAATTFTTNLMVLVEELDSIRNSGGSGIIESLSSNFDTVIKNLSNVLSHPNTRLSVHDPIIPIAKGFRAQITALKKSALQIVENSNTNEHVDQYHLLIEIRNFSSDLNNAFTNEFTKCSYGPNENEKLRAVSMTACNDILQGTKSLINFKSQIMASLENFEKFRKKVNVVLQSLGLPDLNPILPVSSADEEEEDKKEVKIDISPSIANNNTSSTNNTLVHEPEIYSSLTLKEILLQSRDYMLKNCATKKFCEKFFSVLSSKSDIIDSKEIHLLGQITELQSKYSDLTTKTRILEQQNQNLKDNLTSQQNKDQTENYFECIKYISKNIQEYLEDGLSPAEKSTLTFNKTKNVIENACEMADKLKHKRCPNCSHLETNCARVKDILLSIDNVKDSNNLIVVAESAHDSYMQLQCNHQMLTRNLKKAENDSTQVQSQINIILKEFPLADLNSIDICDEIVKQIRNERELHKAQIDKEISNSRQRISKFEKDISNKFSQTFETEPSLPLLSQFKVIQTQLKTNKETISQLQSQLDDIKSRLSKYLSITDNAKSLSDLLDTLEAHEMPSESFVEQEKQCITQLNDCENRIMILLAREKNKPKITFSAAIRSLNLAVSSLSEHIDGIDKNERLKKSYLSQSQSSLEMVYLKLIKFLQIKEDIDANHSKRSFNDIVVSINELVDKVIQTAGSSSALSAATVNQIFQNVLPLLNQSSRDDPLVYLQEISTNYAIYHESIQVLNPFAETLNNIFQNFDCKVQSFAPGSSSFAFIRQEVYQMHNSLNSIGPSKVHSLLFLVLSRFVALTSSFISALSSLSFQNDKNIENSTE